MQKDQDGLFRKPRVLRSGGGPVSEPAVGQWYWVHHHDNIQDKTGKWKHTRRSTLACVTRLGSNYVKLESVADPYAHTWRIHNEKFHDECTFEPDAARIVARRIDKHRREGARLMGQVQELTRRLGVATRVGLQDGAQAETQALAIRNDGTAIGRYKTDLVEAKDKTLPQLFEAIEKENKRMGAWMSASLIPLEAQVRAMQPAIRAIKNRLFNVELYAGLTEQVVQIADGAPADIGERLRIFQRRAYMDEECLAQYAAGGMEFKDIGQFDRWLKKRANRDRLLPFPRCMLAFMVRRHAKERDMDLRAFLRFSLSGEGDLDKLTFLYIRNGDQLFRLKTAVEFGYQLFPDPNTMTFGSGNVLYARFFADRIDKDAPLITEGEYLERVQQHKAAVEAMKERKRQAKKGEWVSDYVYDGHVRDYRKWTPDDVYYDDIAAHVKDQLDAHNRLVLVLQGLFDRSLVLHPHPPVQLWTEAGFTAAIALVYDDARALTPGDAPDFEAYRQRLNASIRVGSVTVGQHVVWEEHEAQNENERQRRDWRIRNSSDYKRYRPHGNPGPGLLAHVARVTKSECVFRWYRERRRDSWRADNIPCTISAPTGRLLNADAYTPGDFRQFFADPRTRADYLQWAPLLLAAEDYKAGNIEPSKPASGGR